MIGTGCFFAGTLFVFVIFPVISAFMVEGLGIMHAAAVKPPFEQRDHKDDEEKHP